MSLRAASKSEASSTFHAPPGSDTGGIQLDVGLTGECEGEQPGYVWGATALVSLADTGSGVVDPFNGGSPLLASLTAVPVTMVFAQATDVTTAPTSPTPDQTTPPTVATSVTRFKTDLGFTMDIPSDWSTTSVQDEVVISASTGDPYVQIDRVMGDPPRDDSSFPLKFDDYAGDNQPHFWGDGQTFIIQWLTGTPDPLTLTDEALVAHMVESIRFEHWQPGDSRNGWTVASDGTNKLPTTSPAWVSANSALWIVTKKGDYRWAYGPIELCNGASTSVDEQAGTASITCANGAQGTWDAAGKPASGNSFGWDQQLISYPAVVSWDGYLLIQLPVG